MSHVIEEPVQRRYRGTRLLDLTTVDVAGGRRTTTVPYLNDGERSLLIAAGDPPWYRDLLDQPTATVRAGSLTYPADAVVVEGEERDRVFARALEADAAWADAVDGAPVAVVALTPVFEGMPAKVGDHLIVIHDVFRAELAAVRQELADSGPGLVAQLRINCLTFCHNLHQHHTGESQAIFPRLAEQYPRLGPALERLDREHEVVRRLLDEIQEILRRDEPGADLVAEFDRLAAELEVHLAYEEEQLVAALNELTFEE